MRKTFLLSISLCLVITISLHAQPVISYQPVVSSGLLQPLDIANAADGTGRIFIAEKGGTIKIFNGSSVLATPFLDISDKISTHQDRGLLSFTFHPQYRTNGFFFVFYTEKTAGAITLARYKVSVNMNVADPASGVVLMSIPKPVKTDGTTFIDHNGGDLNFGRDGYLYVSTGDGGQESYAQDAADPFHLAQNGNSLLGKVLRIDVNVSSPPYYKIPTNNPFVVNPNIKDEIWAMGLRNPWRWSFDRLTGDMWLADVGHTSWEEINFRPATSAGGENYGWRCYESNTPYNLSACNSNAVFTPPVYEYFHNWTQASVTGGYVYRGTEFPILTGYYIAADFSTGSTFLIKPSGNTGWQVTAQHGLVKGIVGFGEAENGSLFAVCFSNNTMYKIVSGLNPGTTSILCPGNKSVSTDAGKCNAILTGSDPAITPAGAPFNFTLSGATTLSGPGTASGKTLNKGLTTVTYTLADGSKSCAFAVTVTPPAEVCGNGIDDDCDGLVDESLQLFYLDSDKDGFGGSTTTTACTAPPGYITKGGDCNDNSNTVYPGAPELCDGLDNNCDGISEQLITYYADTDRDGFGGNTSVKSCTAPAGYITRGGDCNDSRNTIYPGAVEICDGLDNDCDGLRDEGVGQQATYYLDADKDGFGSNSSVTACMLPAGYVTKKGDCNDSRNTVYPGAAELCDGLDNDCDGFTDENISQKNTYYLDADKDGYGDPLKSVKACVQPSGYVANSKDNCITLWNPDQSDLDRDGKGDVCDPVMNVSRVIEDLISAINRYVGDNSKYYLMFDLWQAQRECSEQDAEDAVTELEAFIILAGANSQLNDLEEKELVTKARALITAIKAGRSDCDGYDNRTITEMRSEIQEENTQGTTSSSTEDHDRLILLRYPNPSRSAFKLQVRSTNTREKITLRIIDMYGRVIEVKASVTAGAIIQVGENYAPGIYLAQIMQGKEKVTVKLLKMSD